MFLMFVSFFCLVIFSCFLSSKLNSEEFCWPCQVKFPFMFAIFLLFENFKRCHITPSLQFSNRQNFALIEMRTPPWKWSPTPQTIPSTYVNERLFLAMKLIPSSRVVWRISWNWMFINKTPFPTPSYSPGHSCCGGQPFLFVFQPKSLGILCFRQLLELCVFLVLFEELGFGFVYF